jgi:DNA-directed RNA polymerase subunit alpha
MYNVELARVAQGDTWRIHVLSAEVTKVPRTISDIEKACLSGRSDEAEKLLSKSASGGTETVEYQYHLGLVRDAQGRYEDALEAYERALQLEPTHRGTLFRLAFLYDLRGEESLAIDYYKQCVAQPPVYEGALMNLGVLYEDAGRYEEAIDCFSRVLKANSANQRARLFLRDAQSSRAMFYDEESERRRDKRNQVLEVPVTDFELSVRSRNCLKKMNIRTLGDLIAHTEQELLSYKNFGETSLQEIKDMLTSKGLHLGMGGDSKDEKRYSSLITSAPAAPVVPIAAPASSGAGRTPATAITVADLELSARSRKALERLGIATLGDLANLSEEKLLGCKNFGETSLNEVKQILRRHNLSLSTQ